MPSVSSLISQGATLQGKNLVDASNNVVLPNLNIQQYREANTLLKSKPNAQTAETPAPAQAVQTEAQGSQQQPAVDQPARQEAQNVRTLRPATEGDSEGSYPQGSVDARSVGNNSLDRGGVDAGEQGSRNPAESDSGVPDARTGGSSGLVAKRPTPSKPEGSSIDRAVRTLMDRTNGNGSPDGLIGPENQDARAEIISALTGKPAESLSVLEKSLSAMETQLHRAAGITEGSIRERRSRFIDWIDKQEKPPTPAKSSQSKPNTQDSYIRPDMLSVPSDEESEKSNKDVDSLSEKEAEAVSARLGKKPGKDPYAAIKTEHPDDVARAIAGDVWNGSKWIPAGMADASANSPANQEPVKTSGDLEALFSGLDSSSVRKANKAKKAAKAHPLADKIQNVQENFMDILTELEDSGLVKINCD